MEYRLLQLYCRHFKFMTGFTQEMISDLATLYTPIEAGIPQGRVLDH